MIIKCKNCGKKFEKIGKRIYCSSECYDYCRHIKTNQWHKLHSKHLKEYRESHRERFKEYRKSYREHYNAWYREKKLQDKLFRLRENVSSFTCRIIKNKTITNKSYEYVGCSTEELIKYIEKQFKPWMTWDNHGKYNGKLNYGWDIDHIIPLSSAKTEEELKKLSHYTNIQPLDSKINRYIKRHKI